MEKFKLKLGERELVVEIKNLAEQANGSLLIRYGDTLILATCVMSKLEKENLDFFPLIVDYEERYYAAGKIRGGRFMKREGKPSDEAILVSRLIDRPIRPLFPKNLNREVQVLLTCLSWDAENDPDIIGIIGASLSLSISDIPWSGPISSVRVARIDDRFVINPTYQQREQSQFDLVLTGVEQKGEILTNMIEGGFDETSEELLSGAFEFAIPYLKQAIDFQKEIMETVGKTKVTIQEKQKDTELEEEVRYIIKDRLEEALYQTNKAKRIASVDEIKQEVSTIIGEKDPYKIKSALALVDDEIEKIIHNNIVQNGKRPDGRKIDEIRQLHVEAGLLPRTHGSGLFERGQTKSLSILTLGSPGDQQLLEGMEIVGKKRFMHHYNFPPYSVGEIKPMRGPGRREIGHGMLAEKALLPLIPSFEEFPYTIRVVSEILSSNGSSSMAAVSSSSLALMDAGVPIKGPATGIAIGLMTDQSSIVDNPNKKYKILADIQGPEDHYGDMDFKIAGTRNGITAIQMDVKIKGISHNIFKEALSLGQKIRAQILDEIEKTLAKPRENLSPYAPRIITIKINPEKIREVIGPGGKVINEIIANTGAAIDIDQSGLVFITSENQEGAQKAADIIEGITREVQIGETFNGKVKRLIDFGAFVEILPNQEGLIHISQLSTNRAKKINELAKVGDVIPVKVISIDEQGRINLAPEKSAKR
ncbi:MAG: polyribonucleotide nucleotidyltransferase, polyribonucleotide nucleotidyltransferase [Parcubacteria group bacterium GW2011_GWC1_38_6]|nr:MAG: Polyribonucleotide nucleotidyltransferase [Parcubacteria group bacterium GW2011_GWA1_36_12]KKQ76958.1 MAG: polyribonucleotide nucleotidyltransferase, polyribonucleotide nucleotidyltransferase [Parcubacteria group bacterium GW2011_GWC1_38_6]